MPTTNNNLDLKIAEFNLAIQRYKSNTIYHGLERINSVFILSLQLITLYEIQQTYDGTSLPIVLIAFIAAYFLTDFINGLIHMYMDNNTQYTSIIGPFISSFHLHHATLRYTHHNALKVYLCESGTKFWLLAYLAGLSLAQQYFSLNYAVNVCLVSIGILSSFAEVSHYWCHNAIKKNKIILLLQKQGILLSKKHHMIHHREDNTHYAFLNGVTDPLLNIISRYYYSGYKNHADKHTEAYIKVCL